MTLVEIGTVSIAAELNAPLATTTAGGVGIGAGIIVGAGLLLVGMALLAK